jgi:hypothetical protein
MEPLDTKKMREAHLTTRVTTHYEDCEYKHPYCAISALCAEVDGLRVQVKILQEANSKIAIGILDQLIEQLEKEKQNE